MDTVIAWMVFIELHATWKIFCQSFKKMENESMNSTAKGVNTFFLLQVKPSNNHFRNSIFMREKERKRNIHTHTNQKQSHFYLINSQNTCRRCFIEWWVHTFPKSVFILVMEVETVVATTREGFPKSSFKLFLHKPNKKQNGKTPRNMRWYSTNYGS
jgi:hypothetical protein